MTYFGFGGYVVSLDRLAKIVPVMQAYHMNTIRINGTPIWKTQGTHALKFEYVDYILANTDFNVIVNPNHLYPPDTVSAADFIAHIDQARARLLEVANRYKDNARVFIEIVNEFYPVAQLPNGTFDSTDYNIVHGLINDVRAVCSNAVVWCKQPPGRPYMQLQDGLVFQGDHGYFGDGQYSETLMFSRMQAARTQYGIEMICTEVGADWNEGAAFTQTSVNRLNWFLENCNNANFGVLIHLRELEGDDVNPNLIAYKKFGLKIPSDIIPPPEMFALDISTETGGTTIPIGRTIYQSGRDVQMTATAAEGYVFGGWVVNNQLYAANPLTLTITENLTVMPIFNLAPEPPPPPQNKIKGVAAAAAVITIVTAVLYALTR